ncbi:DNA ligase I [Pisolithus croceorrhizus]|nr:DNA ligase I [Pisolithus croceorrhizus]
MFAARHIRRVIRVMGRQQTLGKFFEMPKGIKPAPPQQSSLSDMWGRAKPKESTSNDGDPKSKTVEEVGETASKPKRRVPGDQASPGPSTSKRRRVVHSDDEEDVKDAGSLHMPSAPPSSRSITPPSSLPSGSSKGKATISPHPPPEDEGLSDSEREEGVGDDEAVGTEDEVDDATQNAEAALSRVADVDVKGGWKPGDPVPYASLAKTFSLIEATTRRLEKTSLLTSFFFLVIQRRAKGDSSSLLQSVYLCINRLSPDYVGVELGIGESLLIKAISESTGRNLATLKAELKKEGDLGLVAMNSKRSQKTLFKPRPLTVPFVFTNLREIALSSGHSSQAKKVSIITKLLAACQEVEAKYIVRSLEGKLRIGNAERTVLVALAHAVVLADKEQNGKKWNKEKLESPTRRALLEHGVMKLKSVCKLTPGVPLKPMLAKPTKAIGDVLDRFENKRFTCEYKYDGERAQVHKLEKGSVAIFSRNSEDMSNKYPDLVEQLPHRQSLSRTPTGKLMPFQELSRRKRKDVKVEDIQVHVCLFAFDLLYLNGEVCPSSINRSGSDENSYKNTFELVPGEFDFARSSDGESTDEIQAFLEESVKDGVNWLKLKKDYLAGVGDSLDLVVVGGYYGKGKRTNVYGAFLLACYDADAEEYQTICKIGTGFSEEVLQNHWDALRPLESQKPRGDVKAGGAKPDIWFEPKVVWEVLTADLSLSPVYTAAQGLVDERGISLRFPRFIRVRDDKLAEDATGPEQIAEMYERQTLAQSRAGKNKATDGDDEFW